MGVFKLSGVDEAGRGCLSEASFLLEYFSSPEEYRRFVYEAHEEAVIGKYVNLPKVRRGF